MENIYIPNLRSFYLIIVPIALFFRAQGTHPENKVKKTDMLFLNVSESAHSDTLTRWLMHMY